MDDDALTALCLRFLAGDCSPEERESLGRLLVVDPSARALYRDVCRHSVWMRETVSGAGAEAGRIPFESSRGARVRVLAFAAAAMVLMVGGLKRLRSPIAPPSGRASVLSDAAAPAAAPVFVYPFEGFPVLESPEAAASPSEPLEVPGLGDPDARILRIARHFNGLPPTPSLEL